MLHHRWVRFIILLVAIPLIAVLRWWFTAWDLSYEEVSDL